jgi:hypothetical protein
MVTYEAWTDLVERFRSHLEKEKQAMIIATASRTFTGEMWRASALAADASAVVRETQLLSEELAKGARKRGLALIIEEPMEYLIEDCDDTRPVDDSRLFSSIPPHWTQVGMNQVVHLRLCGYGIPILKLEAPDAP